VTGQYDGSTYPEGFRWAWLFPEQRSVFATVGSFCPLYKLLSSRIGLSICLYNAPRTDAVPK